MKIVVGLEMVVGIDNKAAGDPVPAGDLRERGVAGRQRLPPGLGQDAFAGMVHAPTRDGRQSFRRDVRKDHALLGELVKMRCLDAPAAVAAHVVGAECVGDDNDDVQAAELAPPAAGPRLPDHTGDFSAAFLGPAAALPASAAAPAAATVPTNALRLIDSGSWPAGGMDLSEALSFSCDIMIFQDIKDQGPFCAVHRSGVYAAALRMPEA